MACPDRAAQQEVARERHLELTAEAVTAALLAADGLLGDWVVGDGGDSAATVDDMLGPPQATALVCAALSVVPDDGPALAAVIGRHVAPGLVLPRAAEDSERRDQPGCSKTTVWPPAPACPC